MNIRRVRTTRGTRSVLTYWYRGVRYRPVLGLNLTIDQERESANRIISAIHQNTNQPAVVTETADTASSFEEFLPTYFQFLKAKRRDADKRNEIALRLHLIPFFGQKLLKDIRLEDGLAYLEQRQTDGAAEGTVERECAVLMAILNLAVDFEALDKNRLRRLPVPTGIKRVRILDASDLHKLRKVASEPVWRAIIADLQTGLRVNKLFESHAEWVIQKGDGYWLYPAPSRSVIKGVPKALPLNQLAIEALYGKTPRISGRFFEQWKDAGSFKNRWQQTVERAGLKGLVFHDIRRTFATWLTECGVDYAVIRMLRGEPLPGSAKYYIQNWDAPLREAVTRLEAFTRRILEGESAIEVPLTATSVPLSYVEQSLSARKMVSRLGFEPRTLALKVRLVQFVIGLILRRFPRFFLSLNGLRRFYLVDQIERVRSILKISSTNLAHGRGEPVCCESLAF